MTHPARTFRFGTGVSATGSRAQMRQQARQAEELGYDVISIGDHLGMPAPFSTLVALAEATSTIKVGTGMVNAGFYNPTLLARDVATTDMLVDGRLELGLGAGPEFARREFDQAGLPFPSPGRRIEHLRTVIDELARLLGSPTHVPRPVQRPRPPLLIAGGGPRILRLAAEHADIINLAITATATTPGGNDTTTEQIEHIRAAAGPRIDRIELALNVLPVDLAGGARDLSVLRIIAPHATEEQLLAMPSTLLGSARQIADTLLGYRATYGMTYFVVPPEQMAAFAPVIDMLTGSRPVRGRGPDG